MKYRDELIAYDKKNHILHDKDIERAFKKQEYIENHEGVVYKPEVVDNVIAFIESQFMQTKGVLKHVVLQPTQKWWLEIIFGYYDEHDNILINEIFISIIRGAGKSTLMAAVVITWMLLSDNFGGEGQVIAYDNTQADEVYGQVLKQLQAGGDIIKFFSENQTVKINGKVIHVPEQLHKTRDGIVFRRNLNTFKKTTNDENRVQGGNTVLNIFDEVHTYKKQIIKQVNMGSRKQPSWRSIYITSGGIVRNGQYDDLIKQFTSEENFKDIHTFGFIYRLDDAKEVTDERNWTKAAPMIGVLPKWEKVRAEYLEAKGNAALQTRFLAYDMGLQMQDAGVYFLQPTEAAPRDYNKDIWYGASVFMGVDVSYSGDWSSVSFLTTVGRNWFVHTESLTTKSSIDSMPPKMKQKVESFVGHGLTCIDRDRIKAQDIFDVVSAFIDEHGLGIEKIGYDRYNYDELHDLFFNNYVPDADDAKQVPIRQGYALSESLNLMKSLMADGRFYHDQPVLEWSLMNLGVHIGISGDIMMQKFSYPEKIDPVAATVFAIEVSK